jgi:hypothetical protein
MERETNPLHRQDSVSPKGFFNALNFLGKIALSIGLLLSCIFCISLVIDAGKSQTRSDAKSSDKQPSALSLQENFLGNWVFTELPWSIQIQLLPRSKARELFEQEIPVLKSIESTDQDLGNLDLIYDLLVGLDAKMEIKEGNTIYRSRNDSVQAIAFAPMVNDRQIQVVRLIQDTGADTVNYFELNAAHPKKKPATFIENQLLPMPKSASRLAVRLDNQNSICGALYELDESLDLAKMHWEDEGWTIQALSSLLMEKDQLGQAAPEVPHQDSQPLACLQGQDLLVVFPLPSVSKETFLLIMRP